MLDLSKTQTSRPLGTSPVTVSTIIAGTWAIGGSRWGGAEPQAGLDSIRQSLRLGINTFDTAPMYGLGKSEELLGQVSREVGRKNLVIITKCGLNWKDSEGSEPTESTDNSGNPITVRRNLRPDRIVQECEDSLKRLGTDYIDVYMIHKPDSSTPVEDSIGALASLQKQGKVRAIGVSNFDLPLLKRAQAIAQLACLEPRYSIISRGIENEIIPFCKQHSIGIIGFSTQEKGLLTGAVTADRQFKADDVRSTSKQFTKENIEKVLEALEQIKGLAKFKRCTVGNLVVAWTIRQPGITASLVGARDERQASENAVSLQLRLSASELKEIESAFKTFTKPSE